MKFTVIGCGYFGSQVARLWKELGFEVCVTTRSSQRAQQLNQLGFNAVTIDVTESNSLTKLPESDVVLFSIGFDRSSADDIRSVYVDGFENVLESLSDSTKQLIYISSTGVLANSHGQWIDESAPTGPLREGAKAHLEAEQMLQASRLSDRSVILRLAGIYGPNRVPRLSAVVQRQWHLLPTKGHVNLIHVVDAAGITNRVVELGLMNTLYHVSDGQPPMRKALYEFVAKQVGAGDIDWDVPTDAIVAVRSASNKLISNRKLTTETGYQFAYPDYRAGVAAALTQTDLSGIR